MKTLITYYSYSGITEKVIAIFKEILEKKSELMISSTKLSKPSATGPVHPVPCRNQAQRSPADFRQS